MDVTTLISIGTGIVASEDERSEYLLDSVDGISLKIGADHASFNPDSWGKYKNDYLLIIEEFNEDGLKNNYFYFEHLSHCSC